MIPVAADMACMCLLKATAKEVLRLYPVIPAKAKGHSEKDIQVGGYIIPKNTYLALSRILTGSETKPDPRGFAVKLMTQTL